MFRDEVLFCLRKNILSGLITVFLVFVAAKLGGMECKKVTVTFQQILGHDI